MTFRVRKALVVLVGMGLILPAVASAQAPPRGSAAADSGLSPTLRQQLLESHDRGAAFLLSQRQADGTWEKHMGITALAATALLRRPNVPHEQSLAQVGPTLDRLAALAKPDGGIHDGAIPHYVTAVSVTAFVAGGRAQDRPLVERGRRYLADRLLDEGEGIASTDKWYGGMGYGGPGTGGRLADIVSLEYAMRAMKDADLPANDPAWQKAMTFLQRTQNHSETNDQTWAANDGGFVYYPGFTYHAEGGTRSYGSATYAGVLSYSWADVKRDDQRVQAVLDWIGDNYTVEENPGTGQKTVYYYYMVFAKALQAVGEPTIVDGRGRRHNWREDLGRKLLALQNADGSWVNSNPAEMQDNKVLVTCFTMTALQAILAE